MDRVGEFEAELGPQLRSYRGRSGWAIHRSLDVPLANSVASLILAAWLAFMLTIPVLYAAERAGAVIPVWKDRAYGPWVLCWFLACLSTLLWLMYAAPRRMFLAIHEHGFVIRGLFGCRVIRYRDVTMCELFAGSGRLFVSLNDGTRLNLTLLAASFSPQAREELLAAIVTRQPHASRICAVDHGLRNIVHTIGQLCGITLLAIVAIVPVSTAESRVLVHKAVGPRFCGVPSEISVPLVVTLLFLPVAAAVPHLMVSQGAQMKAWFIDGRYGEAEVRRSHWISLAGIIYFAALGIAWAAYAAVRGI